MTLHCPATESSVSLWFMLMKGFVSRICEGNIPLRNIYCISDEAWKINPNVHVHK